MAKTPTKAVKEEDENEKKTIVTGSEILMSHLTDKNSKKDHYNFDERIKWTVSTGSLLLDDATGGVQPSLWRLAGQNNSGKTPQMLEIVRNILRDVPNSKCLWVIAEGRYPSKENAERCGLKFVSDPKDWKVGTIFVLESNVFELIIKIIKDLVQSNDEEIRYAFVIDSVDGLILKNDIAKDIDGDNKVAGVPALSKKMLQSLSLGMFKFGHWMGLISQVTTGIKINKYEKTPNRGGNFSGGNALLHASDIILEYEPSQRDDFIMEGAAKLNEKDAGKPIGQNVRVILGKSVRESTKKMTLAYPVKYGRRPSGIWVEREIGDLLLGWEMAKKATAWLTFTPATIEEIKKETGVEIPEKIQGMEKLYSYLEENKPVADYLFKKFSKMTIIE